MTKSTCLRLLFVAFFLFSAGKSSAWSGLVIGVADGDTIIVKHNTDTKVIRLFGIDCPEKGQEFGRKAKRFTSALVFKKIVHVHPTGETSYGRTVAWVEINGTSVNKELIRAGLAWWYRSYAYNYPELGELETAARNKKLGLRSVPNPIPPWEFRRQN